MKMLLILNFFFAFQFVNCQVTERIELKKELTEEDYLPQIEGIYTGKIDVTTLGSKSGITNNASWLVTSFKISYPCGAEYFSISVKSNFIPENLILDIVKCALKEQVFITEIIAIDEQKKQHLLNSMVFIPLPSDEK